MDMQGIANTLNEYFSGGSPRKIVFWYDAEGDFAEDIDTLALTGAKLHKLKPDNQFYTKHLLERQDTGSHYLLYAPFEKPDLCDNALEDILLYSKRFHADRTSMLANALGLSEASHPLLKKHARFFQSKDRLQRLKELHPEQGADLETALLSVLCKARTASYEAVLRTLLADQTLYAEIEKFNLGEAFWRLCEEALGYAGKPELSRLAVSLMVTHLAGQLQGKLPAQWQSLLCSKTGSASAFVESMMHSTIYQSTFHTLSREAGSTLHAREVLSKLPPEALLGSDTFAFLDELILEWSLGRLLAEDTGAALAGQDIPAVCAARKKQHFGRQFAVQYHLLAAAHFVIRQASYACPTELPALAQRYTKQDYRIDQQYREFYTALDRMDDAGAYEPLRQLVENIYANSYMGQLLPAWSAALCSGTTLERYGQRQFFRKHVQGAKERVVVLISDALRYEVGQALFSRLCDEAGLYVRTDWMLAAPPTITSLGMAALLPHNELALQADGSVLADGCPSGGTEKREAILQKAVPKSRCLRADALPSKREELRALLYGMDVVYIYHDQIDARGGKASTENEVFNACAEAVEELFALVKRLVSARVYRFFITADHGFLYQRDGFAEKISLSGLPTSIKSRRFVVAEQALAAQGMAAITTENGDAVTWPAGAAVFQTQGGQCFVHGGASPQEMIVPLLRIKAERGKVETRPAKIEVVGTLRKITNLLTPLEFYQTEAIGDIVKAMTYRLFFVDKENESISAQQVFYADHREKEPAKRIQKLRFRFKNQKYDSDALYYLVAVAEDGMELFRQEVRMDIIFADDFGFEL